ncbi:MAG: hypothetical protein HC808_17965 [Candidatus Competibacteraceae bacterium]|nr:hypothetical protein [Candidatus Competibacteraceae bacterium]
MLELRISGLPLGSTVLQAQDRAGLVWSAVTLDVKSMPATSFTVTRQQLTDATGVVQAKYPPSPAIRALIDLLKDGTGGALKAGAGLLESAGRSGNLYEHTAGLALDIYRNSKNPAQQRQAHNLIRFFIRNRRTLGWRNMFYESWGFSSSGKVGGAPNHNDHIHIDWMDFRCSNSRARTNSTAPSGRKSPGHSRRGCARGSILRKTPNKSRQPGTIRRRLFSRTPKSSACIDEPRR